MAAPSAVNQQPWEFYVVTDKAVLEKLAAASPYAAMTAKAPAAIVLCSRTENILVPELVDVDMGIGWRNAGYCSLCRPYGKGCRGSILARNSQALYNRALRLSCQEKSPARPF